MSTEKKSKKGLIIGAVAVAIAALGMVGATGCSSSDSDDSSLKEVVSASSSENENEPAANVEETEESVTNEEETEESEADEPEEESAPTIDEQVLWEIDGVTITATGLEEDSLFGTEIGVLVENDSDSDIGIGADAVIVNDYMITDLTSMTVTAGNKSNDAITLLSSELEAAGIDKIGKIELYLHTFDPDTYSTLNESGCITIETSEFENMDTENNIDGVTLFEQDGVKIVAQYVDEDSFWGQAVLLYIENNSQSNIIVQCDDVSVNGYMVSALLSEDVYAGKKAFTDITLLQSDLDENGITDIETIETSFSILDQDFNTIAESGKVSFSTK